jgi:hypothetical protein
MKLSISKFIFTIDKELLLSKKSYHNIQNELDFFELYNWYGSYFYSRAQLPLHLCLAGRITVKKLNLG